MATLKYRSKDGVIKTLGINLSGGAVSSVNGRTGAVTGLYDADNPPPYPVTSVNGKTGDVTGLYDSENPPPYPVKSVNGKTGAVTISSSTIKTASLTFNFSGEDAAHICKSNIVSNANKIISINPVSKSYFVGGIRYENGYIITLINNSDGEVAGSVTCNVVYYV